MARLFADTRLLKFITAVESLSFLVSLVFRALVKFRQRGVWQVRLSVPALLSLTTEDGTLEHGEVTRGGVSAKSKGVKEFGKSSGEVKKGGVMFGASQMWQNPGKTIVQDGMVVVGGLSHVRASEMEVIATHVAVNTLLLPSTFLTTPTTWPSWRARVQLNITCLHKKQTGNEGRGSRAVSHFLK